MNKKLIRLTEQDLHRIVKESVERILNEHDSYAIGRGLGRLYGVADHHRLGASIGLSNGQKRSEINKSYQNAIDAEDKAIRLRKKAKESFGGINDDDVSTGFEETRWDPFDLKKRGILKK